MPTGYHDEVSTISSSIGYSDSIMSTEELLAFARAALDETAEKQRAALDGGAQLPFGYGPQPGDTLDLGDKGILTLPAELIMLIKNRVERLAIGHNRLTELPSQIGLCSNLLYLNLRHNKFTAIPESVLSLRNLQILDISFNELSTVPADISKMYSLMFLALEGNKIRRLPTCLGEMSRLTKVKFGGNPLEFPPREVLTVNASGSTSNGVQIEEARQICTQVKSFLRDCTLREQVKRDAETSEVNSETNMETPRPPRRTVSGRFPVRPSISGIDGVEPLRINTENGLMPPPPIPQRSRARDSVILQNPVRRPSIATLTSEGERSRSRSDTAASSSSQRAKRLGFVPRKTSAGGSTLGAIDTGTIRPLHYRGPSQLSNSSFAMHSGNESSSGAVSPVDSPVPRLPITRRRLSSLPEDRRASRPTSVTIKLATRIYFAVFQLNNPIGDAVRIIKNGTPRKNVIAIERAFFEASASLEELGRRLDQLASDTGEHKATERDPWIQAIRKKSGHVLSTYGALVGELRVHSRRISQRGEAMYIRNLMLHLYGALVEVKNIMDFQKTEIIQARTPVKSTRSSLVTSSSRSVTPTQTKPYPKKRLRGATILQPSRLATPGSVPPPVALSTSRSNTMTSASGPPPLSATTPRSGESFPPIPISRSTTQQGHYEDSDEQRQFESIYIKYQHTCDIASQVLPGCRVDFFSRKEGAARSMQARVAQHWTLVLEKCDISIHALETLRERLAMVKAKEPGLRNHRDFLVSGERFTRAFFEVAVELKNMHRQGHDTAGIGSVMRPLHQAIKDVSYTLTAYPIYHRSGNHPLSGYVTPIPATPLSAALGPAALATVPNTPRETPGLQNQAEYFTNGGQLNTGDGMRTVHPFQGEKMVRYARELRGPTNT